MNGPTIRFHGAARTVTGSCMELTWQDRRILVDCGLFQGSRTLEALNHEPFAFVPKEIDAVVLTHAHIDHSGLLPRLVAEGFRGDIWCTAPTADLLGYMLPDSACIQEGEAARRNRRADRADEKPVRPLYTEDDAMAALDRLRPVDLETWFEPAPGFRARLWNAGHILGSASVEMVAGGARLLFSGDLGPDHKAFYADPEAPEGFDHVVCESTYGDRVREPVTIEQRRTMLEAEIKAALTRGGNLVVPVFAVERTQELLADIALLIHTGRLSNVPVFIDSPLASGATRVFARYQDEFEGLGQVDVFRHRSFHYVESVQESIRLNDVSGAIILSASGMCEAGRIRHHLLHNLPRPDSTVLFVGFQARGTLGRAILEGAQRVRISGRDVAVRAQIRRIDSYSAHADQKELLAWIEERQPIAGSLMLSHGEAEAIETLRRRVQSEGRISSIIVPEIGEGYVLPKGAPARRIATGREDLRDGLEHDWQNDYADFAANLKATLKRIETGAARRQALREMKAVLERYAAHRSAHGGHR